MPENSKSKKHYPPEFREKAVKLITELGYTVEQVAEKFGCCKGSVRRWKAAAMPKLDPETALRMELEEKELDLFGNFNLGVLAKLILSN